MGSMSYCRFENTVSDFSQCVLDLEECETEEQLFAKKNEYERQAYLDMIELCEEFLYQVERLRGAK